VQNIVTGRYLNRARVTLRGGDQVVLTDEFGTCRLVGVPSPRGQAATRHRAQFPPSVQRPTCDNHGSTRINPDGG
jgi:hypothetical protein